jgi:hypothetical protein
MIAGIFRSQIFNWASGQRLALIWKKNPKSIWIAVLSTACQRAIRKRH